jgi:transposase
MKPTVCTVGIELVKNLFHLAGTDTTGKMVWRQRLTCNARAPLMAPLPPVTIGMEACGGAHDWARQFHPQGHQVNLRAPQFVKPYVQAHPNDRRDAEASAEAVTRPTRRFVPLQDGGQPDIHALHRVRARLIGARMALIKDGHGWMQAYGIVLPQGVSKFRHAVVEKLESEPDQLTPLSQELCSRLGQAFAPVEEHIAADQEQHDPLAKTHPERQRLMTIPGIGPITATALSAAVGDVGVLTNGRQFAAW